MNKFAALMIAVAGTASAQDLTITIDITDPSMSTISATLNNAGDFPTGNLSAVNAMDFQIAGLTSFSAPSFPNAFLPGVLPDSNPLAAPFGGVDLASGTVNWFVQFPTLIAPTTGSWTGTDHLIGTFSFEGPFSVDFTNISGGFENPSDTVIGADSVDYLVNGQAGGASFEVVIVPAPASAGLLGLAGLAAARRRRA